MSRALDVVTLTGAEYDALTQRADDWYALYAEEAKKRAKLRDALEPFAAIDLLECRLPPEFAMHVLRARGVLTPNAKWPPTIRKTSRQSAAGTYLGE